MVIFSSSGKNWLSKAKLLYLCLDMLVQREIKGLSFLASIMNVTDGVFMERLDNMAALIIVTQNKKFNVGHVSSSLEQILKLRITRGLVRHNEHIGYERQFINQHRLGVISLYTLRDTEEEIVVATDLS